MTSPAAHPEEAPAPQREREFKFSDSDFRFLADLVHQRAGIKLGDHKRDMVYGRLARRLRQMGIKTFAEYCELLKGEAGIDEMGNLINAVTTNLTSFFREGHHFEHLKDEVLTPLIRGGSKRIRLWSAAASAGMEPYSMAMVLRKSLEAARSIDGKILATDIDTQMLGRGRRGEYSIDEYEKIPAPYRAYAEVNEAARSMQMSEKLRELITFNQLNLLGAWPMKGPFDAVFCRNVVIYFDKDTQRKLFDRIANLLVPGGWLYIGHSENLFNVCDRFKNCGRTIYQKIK